MKDYTLVDLEWTSWKNNYYGKFLEKEKRKKWQKKEIIQIGALKFDRNYKIKNSLETIVKPKINKKLSKHMTNLTSLSDEILEKKGIDFLKAFKKFKKFSKNTYVFSNGHDGKVLKKNLKYNKSKLKNVNVIDIKKIFEKKYSIPKKYLSSPIIKTFFGYKFNPKIAHNALSDCKSVILAMRKMNFDLKIIEKIVLLRKDEKN